MKEIVLGVLDHMDEYANVSERMAAELMNMGNSVSHAITAFNAGTDSTYQVADCGSESIGLGKEIATIDGFVKAIATGLRSADSAAVTFSLGSLAANGVLDSSKEIERLAGDVSLLNLLGRFDAFDGAKDGKLDGLISIKDIERVAARSKDPIEKAEAKWLLEHRSVLDALDRGDSADFSTDGKISKSDIKRYTEQRIAVQVMNDHFDEFDKATTNKADGKVSRQDIEEVMNTTRIQKFARRQKLFSTTNEP
jgi:hypothetical protein